MAIQMQPVDLFMCVSVCGEYRNRLHIPIMDFPPIGFSSLLFSYLILYLPLEMTLWCLLHVTESDH